MIALTITKIYDAVWCNKTRFYVPEIAQHDTRQMSVQPPGAPDYFALFQSMFTPVGAAPPAAAPNPFAMLDPKELEKKIGELETVLAWLKATTGMIEMSIETMKYQQSMLKSFAGKPAEQSADATAPTMQELGRMAEAMNPALWAMNMLQLPESSRPKTARKSAAKQPRAAEKKPRR